MNEKLKQAIAHLEYTLTLLDGQPEEEFYLAPGLSIIQAAQAVVKAAKEEG